ncbi:9310_t:CDS:2 [Ambispora gerdemannii]|uniref:9310_t:CDS:1 n=1 Tax=Ambispora gerdemannii TaxID=144530 RepID=A0A9N9GTC1_9GLOM|nr:9310_t:CDS:2 [Ambispora gerdemannii]
MPVVQQSAAQKIIDNETAALIKGSKETAEEIRKILDRADEDEDELTVRRVEFRKQLKEDLEEQLFAKESYSNSLVAVIKQASRKALTESLKKAIGERNQLAEKLQQEKSLRGKLKHQNHNLSQQLSSKQRRITDLQDQLAKGISQSNFQQTISNLQSNLAKEQTAHNTTKTQKDAIITTLTRERDNLQ